jgi:hypothetical protein
MMLDAEAVRRTGRADREAARNLMVVEGKGFLKCGTDGRLYIIVGAEDHDGSRRW